MRTPSDEKAEIGRSAAPSSALKIVVGLGRAFGAALIFALPMLMTMEMWHLGFTMDRLKLALLLVLALPLLVGLAHRVGFETTFNWREDLRDAAIALGIGFIASSAILLMFDAIDPGMPADEVIGKIAVQAVPAGIGALLGRSQLGGQAGEFDEDENAPLSGYGGEIFMMAIGALFLSLNIAPTEEMILISLMMTPWHALSLTIFSIALMHAFVYAVAFKGSGELSAATPWWSAFIRFTLVGYAIALTISLYALWTFERTEGLAPMAILMSVIVLAFPASAGAAAARLIL